LEELVAVLDDLMCTADQIKIMLFIKVANYSLTKGEAYASVIVPISVNATLRIRPE